jgi:hypothetical protein
MAMGLLLWVAAGLALVGLIRAATRLVNRPRWKPSLAVALIGAVGGGYVVDLLLRGDSVIHFRGPTFAGAVAGTLLLLGASYVFAVATRRHATGAQRSTQGLSRH